jgi:hypothetical protein
LVGLGSDNTHPRRYGTEKAIAAAKGVKSGEAIEIDERELDGNGAITIERLQMLKLVS